MSDCLFCKIANKEHPSTIIYEDDEFLAFLDLYPINPGHTLVIPKKHCQDFLDFPKAEETDLMEFMKKVARAVKKGTHADGFNIGLNSGKAAGQAIFHAHFHIIPRFDNDGLSSWPNKEYKEGQMEEIAKRITKML
jgi:histidine triad (HIT) family protein